MCTDDAHLRFSKNICQKSIARSTNQISCIEDLWFAIRKLKLCWARTQMLSANIPASEGIDVTACKARLLATYRPSRSTV